MFPNVPILNLILGAKITTVISLCVETFTRRWNMDLNNPIDTFQGLKCVHHFVSPINRLTVLLVGHCNIRTLSQKWKKRKKKHSHRFQTFQLRKNINVWQKLAKKSFKKPQLLTQLLPFGLCLLFPSFLSPWQPLNQRGGGRGGWWWRCWGGWWWYRWRWWWQWWWGWWHMSWCWWWKYFDRYEMWTIFTSIGTNTSNTAYNVVL